MGQFFFQWLIVALVGLSSFQINFSRAEQIDVKEMRVHNVALDYTQAKDLNLSDQKDLRDFLFDLDVALNEASFFAKEFPADWQQYQESKIRLGADRTTPTLSELSEGVKITLKTGPRIKDLSFSADENGRVRRRTGTVIHVKIAIGQHFSTDTHFVIYEGKPVLEQMFHLFSDYLSIITLRRDPAALAQLEKNFLTFLERRKDLLSIPSQVEEMTSIKREAKTAALSMLEHMKDGLKEARKAGALAEKLSWGIAAYNSSGSREVMSLSKYFATPVCLAALR